MHECRLCERDMKTSKSLFGAGCVNNIYKFLDIDKPARGKDKEQVLYKNIMKRTKANGLNNNQKILLADRYLTYQYLDKLKYGNFDNIKRKINKDIDNINRIKKTEELATMREIRLKEAYDLYKRERKFENQIKEIKKSERKENEQIKLLLTSMSYIFNLYRNKSQYDKDNLKAMQYAFWQLVIEVGGRYFNYELAAKLLQHALEEKVEEYMITDEQILDMIRRDKNFENKIKDIINGHKLEKQFNIDLGGESLAFQNSDLYFAIHNAYMGIKVERNDDLSWNAEIILSDTFNFDKLKTPLEYYFDTNNIPKSLLSSTLYNLAFISQKLGVIKEYEVVVKFSIKIQKDGKIQK